MKVNSLTHHRQSPSTSDYLSNLTDQTKIKDLVREKLILNNSVWLYRSKGYNSY